MPRYVILRHEMPEHSSRGTHWDLMLEDAGRLRTWAMDHEPTLGAVADALALDDHRMEYLDYEGPVSGGRGSVTRVEAGDYYVVEDDARQLVCRMTHPHGTWTLVMKAALDVHWSAEFSASTHHEPKHKH